MLNSGFKNIDICYKYDGSFYGMLSCVFEAFEKKEMPIQIISEGLSLFAIKNIQTDEIKAQRILKAIPHKINYEALEYVKLSFLANIEGKEIALIHFLKEGFNKIGRKFIEVIRTGFSPAKTVVNAGLKNDYIKKLQKGIDLLALEAQRFIQFVRFNEIKYSTKSSTLVSIIEPVNNVLPLLAEHFIDRYPNEQFLIYDKTHSLGLLHVDHKASIEYIENYELPTLGQQEKDYQKLWRLFYNTVAIEERRNERCRMNFMPKKYWKNMTEFLED